MARSNDISRTSGFLLKLGCQSVTTVAPSNHHRFLRRWLALALLIEGSGAAVAMGQPCANWSSAGSPPPRQAHAMAYDSARGVVVLFGGLDGAEVKGDTWEWDGFHWTQKTPFNSPPPRYGHAMAYDSGRGVTVLTGGNTGSSFAFGTWEWNGTNWTSRIPSSIFSARARHAMAYDSVRHVTVMFGGIGF